MTRLLSVVVSIFMFIGCDIEPSEENSIYDKLPQENSVNTKEIPQKGEKSLVTKGSIPNLHIQQRMSSRYAFISKEVNLYITISNNNCPILDFALTNFVSPQFEYISSEPPGIYESEKHIVKWYWKKLVVGEMQIKLKLRVVGKGKSVNKIKAISKDRTFESQMDLYTRGVVRMSLSSSDTEDPVELGEKTVYVVELVNEGTSNDTNIKMRCILPEQMEFVFAEGPSPYYQNNSWREIIFESVPSLAPKSKLVYKITCRAVKSGRAIFTAIPRSDVGCGCRMRSDEGTSVYRP